MKEMWRIEDGDGNPVSKWVEGEPSDWVKTLILDSHVVVTKSCRNKVEVNWDDLYNLLHIFFHKTEAPDDGVDIRYFKNLLGERR